MGHEHFWTSGTDQAEEGKFFWMSTGKPVTYENWNAGEPNNFQYDQCNFVLCLICVDIPDMRTESRNTVWSSGTGTARGSAGTTPPAPSSPTSSARSRAGRVVLLEGSPAPTCPPRESVPCKTVTLVTVPCKTVTLVTLSVSQTKPCRFEAGSAVLFLYISYLIFLL